MIQRIIGLLVWYFLIKTVLLQTIDDDPSLWPGHLKPFGTLQNTVKVEEIDYWPSPTEFFQEYVDKSRPVLFKGVAKNSPAYKLWDDGYLRDHPGSNKQLVYIEPEKKENRTKQGKVITLEEFISTYHNTSIYMVNGCPKNIMKDVLIPPPLRCEETRRYLKDAVTWFSSGGTKSVVHHDDYENINCLFRGYKQLFFVDNNKYGDFFALKNSGYSGIDVEKVDYTKYPELRLIKEYIRADMEEGDCLFIPLKWIHQVNSQANDKGQNVAVNIWFKHASKHRPKDCQLKPEEASIDKFYFADLEKNQADVEGKPMPEKLSEKYENYLSVTKKQRANLKIFVNLMKKVYTENDKDLKTPEKEFQEHVEKLFKVLDITGNGVLNQKDFEMAEEKDPEAYEESIAEAEDDLLALLEKYGHVQSESEEKVGDAEEDETTTEMRDEL